ncbi:PAS domain-containing serine/threonine-protein kinase-like isoform X1, partial [Clarias magur]
MAGLTVRFNKRRAAFKAHVDFKGDENLSKRSEELAKFPGPLMSSKMQKKELFEFIMMKSQKCLDEIAEPDQVEAFFYWQIVGLFCAHNGKVMMCEVARLLFRAYSLLRQKALGCKGAMSHEQWCLPLARLLCSNIPDDKHRQHVIKMGDYLASRRLTYAAHICYIVAKVELGSHEWMYLVGFDSLPNGLAALNESVMSTETYEYMLSLTSGHAQTNFQIFKLDHAIRLAMLALHDTAFKYCETIARAVITSPGCFTTSLMEKLILLSIYLYKERQQENEPEWLLHLLQLHSLKVADVNANYDEQPGPFTSSDVGPEELVPSTSSNVVCEIQDSKCGKIPALKSLYLEQHSDPDGSVNQSEEFGDLAKFPGPLMSSKMQKKELFQFIMMKSQKCLDEISEPDQVEAFFFWQIVGLFCAHNGKVMMCEVARLLFRAYSLLRQKAFGCKGPMSHERWCLPLVKLLCSNVPDDKHRQLVIRMGDDLASRGLIYAAHICYIVAKVELGSHDRMYLVGFDSLPKGLAALNESIMSTETYEYMLSLTSGHAQTSFQICKLDHAIRLAMLALHDPAFEYCETIARAVITSPGCFTTSLMEKLILLSIKLYKERQQEKEPEFLLHLLQLHSLKVADVNANYDEQPGPFTSSNVGPEELIPSTSSNVVCEIQDSECGKIPALKSLYLEQHSDPEGAMYQSEEFDELAKFPDLLISSKMQKKELFQFIMMKSQKCLDEIAKPDQVEAFFFWQIVGLFCVQNGKVMMCEVARLLFRADGLLRQRASLCKCAMSHEEWCLPLARLLCSNIPDDKHRQNVIKRGDDMDLEGTTNKLVGCYVDESPEDMVLVRVYGNKTELIVDRDNELKSFQVLHANGCAPRLYCTFNNGICYEFMQGDALGTQDVRDPVLLRLIATEMARIHAIHAHNGCIPKPNLWIKMRKYFSLVATEFTDQASNA